LSKPLVIAHRGASAHRPENTLPAFELAVAQRADMIETDLHRTRDGAIVITHDEDLSGLGGRGEIAGATLAEIRALDAGGGEPVPTLDEILDHFGPRIAFNLELKRATDADYDGLEAQALEAVNARGLLGRTLWSSFYDTVLQTLRADSPGARSGCWYRHAPEHWRERARRVGAEAVHLSRRARQRRGDRRARRGLAVHAHTVDSGTRCSVRWISASTGSQQLPGPATRAAALRARSISGVITAYG
jgi:glycerophosphoryl diester phosphodiesterase